MSEIQFVKSEADFDTYVKLNKYLVAHFTASWCGPCQAMNPIVHSLYNDSRFQAIEVVKIDIDTQQSLAARYSITSVPTFLFMENGKIVETMRGAGKQIVEHFAVLQQKAGNDAEPRKGNGSTVETATSPDSGLSDELKDFIPKGYSVLNDLVFPGDFVSLNTLPLSKSSKVKDVFNLKESTTTIVSDADSQMLLYVPLTHISKIYSILIKYRKVDTASDNDNLDADDLEECQKPNLLKLWGNKSNILSFDDADSQSGLHEQELNIEEGWNEIKVKYVRFQNVQNLNIFIDGEDSDYHTMVEKIAIIGVGGEEKDQNILEKLAGEPHE